MNNLCSQATDSQACKQCRGRYCSNKISIFESLGENELKKVTDKIINSEFKKNQMIFFEGDRLNRLYLINRGKVKVFKYSKDGKEQILYILSEGDFIGDSSLFSESEFKFNGKAIEDTNICELTKSDFESIIKSNPDIGLKIIQSSYKRIEKLESLVQSLGNKDIESRISGLLLDFIQKFGTPKGAIIELDIPLSREEMGNYIGVTRETISRKLSSLQDEGVIRLDGRKIIIVELEKLEMKQV